MISLFAALAASTSALALHPAPSTIVAQSDAEAPAAEHTDLGDNLHMIVSRGGNILFSTGEDGTFVVDSQFANTAQENLELIASVSDTPVVFMLNTHYHGDHTGGNEAFYDEGATIVAHDNVRKRLQAQTGDRAVEPDALPVITFSENTTFFWNGKEIRVMHPGAAHTDGDAFVFMPKANVIHTGDLMFSGLYPFIDLDGGGSVEGAINALTMIRDMADKDTKIVPGHGPLSGREDVGDIIKMLQETRQLVRTEMMKGHAREDVIASDPLASYNDDWSWGFIDGDRMAGTHFDDLMATDEEAKAAVETGPAESGSAAAQITPAEPVATTVNAVSDATEQAVEGVAERLEEAQEKTEEAVEGARSRAAEVISDLTSAEDGEDTEASNEDENEDEAPQD
ncbi:MAG: MBL fold metallo-hydrolase [Pseudomonadota bacterium]